MYFGTGLKVENYIYLVEGISRSLISLHISSGKTKIEASLPWKYMEAEIHMFSWKHNIFICSPVMNHFLMYDCQKRQMTTVELQGMESDETGFYYSNVLMDQDDFVVLPFKGKEIKKYGLDGKLKLKDNRWCFSIDRKWGYSGSLPGNIRMNSACLARGQLFFSLVYGGKNYLCRYELNKEEHICSIVYESEDIVIRGVYAYPDKVLFRRLFPDKTEIVLIDLNSNEQRRIRIDGLSVFTEDVYGSIQCLKVSLREKIFQLEGNNLSIHKKIYDFKDSDHYIADGVLVNVERNELLIVNTDSIKSYSIESIIKEIEESTIYQKEYRKLFGGRTEEGKYNLKDFERYVIGQLFTESKEKTVIEDKDIGKLIWKTVS